jgi:hypothetical protein
MLTLQELPLLSELPQLLLLMAKSLGFVPVIEKLLKLTAAPPVLVSTALCAELVVPTVCVEKVRLEVTLSAAAAWPVPESCTTCGLPLTLSAI